MNRVIFYNKYIDKNITLCNILDISEFNGNTNEKNDWVKEQIKSNTILYETVNEKKEVVVEEEKKEKEEKKEEKELEITVSDIFTENVNIHDPFVNKTATLKLQREKMYLLMNQSNPVQNGVYKYNDCKLKRVILTEGTHMTKRLRVKTTNTIYDNVNWIYEKPQWDVIVGRDAIEFNEEKNGEIEPIDESREIIYETVHFDDEKKIENDYTQTNDLRGNVDKTKMNEEKIDLVGYDIQEGIYASYEKEEENKTAGKLVTNDRFLVSSESFDTTTAVSNVTGELIINGSFPISRKACEIMTKIEDVEPCPFANVNHDNSDIFDIPTTSSKVDRYYFTNVNVDDMFNEELHLRPFDTFRLPTPSPLPMKSTSMSASSTPLPPLEEVKVEKYEEGDIQHEI